jgi:multimeric flavodoxin WrbA
MVAGLWVAVLFNRFGEEHLVKLTIMSGSRNPAGQTARAGNALLKGAVQSGLEGEHIFLPPMSIERCRQCDDNGWGTCRSEGKCVIEDDFSGLVEKLRASDVVVFSTPVYFSDLSESLRAFLDRLRRICRHESGKVGIEGKTSAGICVAGGGGGGAPACTVVLEKIMHNCGLDVVDMIPARRQNLDQKLRVFEATGEWLAASKSTVDQ